MATVWVLQKARRESKPLGKAGRESDEECPSLGDPGFKWPSLR